MIIYSFPNDVFAIIYCIGRITLLYMKLIVCRKKSPLFQFEIAFNVIWIFLTPKGGGEETSVFHRKTNSSHVRIQKILSEGVRL